MSALHRIAECAVQAAGMGRTVTQVGPFRACIDPSTDLIFLNYAVPVWALGTPEETREQLERLREIFHQSGRRLRFEFVDGIWPGLPEALEQFGLELQFRVALMACTPDTFRPAHAPGVDVKPVSAGDTEAQRLFHIIQRQAFDAAGEASPEELAQIRHQIRHGFWRCFIASLDGLPAGVGTLVPFEMAAELAGVGTLPDARRRGVAATLSSSLVASHFEGGGGLVWLTALTEAARAAYRTIGFADVGVQWNYMETDAPLHP
ncbi:MAG: GNAT family N-acetyltransferase [Bryobacterales bacterium]|nr:GNAT family N-acetyltransferase [Bryobacterales bacterium]